MKLEVMATEVQFEDKSTTFIVHLRDSGVEADTRLFNCPDGRVWTRSHSKNSLTHIYHHDIKTASEKQGFVGVHTFSGTTDMSVQSEMDKLTAFLAMAMGHDEAKKVVKWYADKHIQQISYSKWGAWQ